MARIRSIHPGQWTDGAFLSCSPLARLLALALRNEADDNGVFAWNAIDLKIRLLPVDNVDIEALLSELVEHGQVQRYTVGSKSFGAIRNFRKWQRPEKPKSVHPFDDSMAPYVGLSPTAPPSKPPPVVDQSSTKVVDQSSNCSAEEGGRRKEEGGKKSTSAYADVSPPVGEDAPAPPADRKPALPIEAAVDAWNDICGPLLGRVAKLTDLRRKHLRARLVEHWPDDPLGGWRGYCDRIKRSDFLTGRRGSTGAHAGWKADFDWICNASNAVKIVEGRYDNERDRPAPPPPGQWREAPGTI